MPYHDLIVIGGSAGALEALLPIVAGLPAGLPAAVCVVIHRAREFPTILPEILSEAGALPAVAAEDGAVLQRGRIVVAVPDFHLLINRDNGDGRIRLVRGPRENRSRPAVDALFRSAALAFGPRVIGVVLSGALDDGTSGLWAVRDRGGLAVIQDPIEAQVPSMPRSALVEAGADYVVSSREIAPLLDRLSRLPVAEPESAVGVSHPHAEELEREVAISAIDEEAHQIPERYGVPSRFACPDCGGVLWDTRNGRGPFQFRCETGHAYSAGSLAALQAEGVESALWAALRALEDKAEFARQRAQHAQELGQTDLETQGRVELEATQEHAAVVRALLRLNGRAGLNPESREGNAGQNASPEGRESASRYDRGAGQGSS